MLVLDYDQLLAVSLTFAKLGPQSSWLSGEGAGLGNGGEPHWEVAKACVDAMGPSGDGFVAVRGMKNYASLRNRLLPLAQRLALSSNVERAAILKEHGLGTDVPLKDAGRPVSSFAAQLRFGSPPDLNIIGSTLSDDYGGPKAQWSSSGDNQSDLGSLFNQLGVCMVEVGLLIARLCDATRSHGGLRLVSEAMLEQAILESGSAKGRLIHYHSFLEQEILPSLQNRRRYKQNMSARERKAEIPKPATESGDSVPSLWQQWHCDYGIFTVLTSPLFLKPTAGVSLEPGHVAAKGEWNEPIRSGLHKPLVDNSIELFTQSCYSRNMKGEEEKSRWLRPPQLSSSSHCFLDADSSIQECAPPDGHSSLLVMDTHGRTKSVFIPSDYLIVQAGETAQLLSGGELVARPHCVTRPTSGKDVSRETMAVFLQPAWDRRLPLPLGTPEERALEAGGIASNLETHIPLLASRWKDGCTFAEFSKETTNQYYGSDGRQSRNI